MSGAAASRTVPSDGPLIVACAALTSDLRAVLGQLGLSDTADVRYVKASLHNRPDLIADAVIEQTTERRVDGRTVVVGFADCGTSGGIDAVVEALQDRGATATRLPGAHCYEFFAGDRFAELHDRSPGTFYLTDFLARHFEALVWAGLGLDRHPELAMTYFGNYTHLVLLSQTHDPEVVLRARAAAERLGLRFDHVHVGRGPLVEAVSVTVSAPARAQVA
jgi:hypothetical protein